MTDFVGFPKIHRLSRPMIVTEKIDGTNAQIVIDEEGVVRAGSRKRWIVPGDDNFGFARWVAEHEEELREGLGVGQHFGEWWGQGIQRGYGLTEKRFSLFNVSRWGEERPACCHVVPVLVEAPFSVDVVNVALETLLAQGSFAAPGFMDPEGVVVFHAASNTLFKKTLHNDEAKG
jgi:hypothetical protein